MSLLKLTITAAAATAALATAVPASAVITTFATFSATNGIRNFRLSNTGNSINAARTNDATLSSTTSAGVAGPALVRFSFLQTALSPFVTDVSAIFNFNGSIARGTPATTSGSTLTQNGISETFSFTSTSAITVTGPHFVPHTYAAGSNLLSGTISFASLSGSGSSAGISASTVAGETITYTSDFLDFSNTVNRDEALSLTAINPPLAKHAGLNGALSSFRATIGGQFGSDPAPLVNGIVPEPGVWMLMVAGFGLVGVAARRRERVVAA